MCRASTTPPRPTFGPRLLALLALLSALCGCQREPHTPRSPAPVPTLTTHQRTAAEQPPANAHAGQIWVDPVDHAAMVYVPAGEALVGAPPGAEQAPEAAPNRPLHKVHVAGFWIDRQPVSNARYRRFVEATGLPGPDSWGPSGVHGPALPWATLANRPAYVTWNEALVYTTWAGKSLPTEEEWEVAARGTDGRRFPWGNAWPDRLRVSPTRLGDREARQLATQKDVSPYGCRDMLFLFQWTGNAGQESGTMIVKGDVEPKALWYSPAYADPPAPPYDRIPSIWFRREDGPGYRWAFRCVLRPSMIAATH
jgi:eukaryotic-like serine/threonine-protein kinase